MTQEEIFNRICWSLNAVPIHNQLTDSLVCVMMNDLFEYIDQLPHDELPAGQLVWTPGTLSSVLLRTQRLNLHDPPPPATVRNANVVTGPGAWFRHNEEE